MSAVIAPNKARRIEPHEWETIGRVAAEVDDLTKVEGRLLAAARGLEQPKGSGTLRPQSWRELMQAVSLGVLRPWEAKRFVEVPEPPRSFWGAFWRRLQRG
jgi:hypothetical protein